MPIYEYQCESCGTTFEAIQKFSDAPLTECRACGAEGVRKLLSAPMFRLKGSGWYETDFKKDKQRNVVKSESDGGSSSSEKSGGDKSGGSDSGSGSSSSGAASSGSSDSGSKPSGKDSKPSASAA